MRRLKASSIPHLIIKRVVSKKGHRRIVYPHRRIEKGAQENRLPTTGELKRYHREIAYPPQEKPSWGVLPPLREEVGR